MNLKMQGIWIYEGRLTGKAAGMNEVLKDALQGNAKLNSRAIYKFWIRCSKSGHFLKEWSTAVNVLIPRKMGY